MRFFGALRGFAANAPYIRTMEPKSFGSPDERTLAQMERCMGVGSVAGGVLCADGHLGYAMPVGGVIAYEEHVSVSGVGFDIACGNMAAKLDLRLEDINADIPTLAADIAKSVSFGLGRTNAERVEHELFDSPLWDDCPEIKHLKTMARDQLGTVGSGNHYVDLFADKDGFVWIGVHFGSRGLGHKTATTFLKLAGGKDGIDVDPAVLPQDSELGQKYLAGMTLAGEYAYAGREWVVERVRSLISGAIVDEVHNHHNYAWRERHDEMHQWLREKGVTLVGGGLDEAPQAYRRLPDVLAAHAGTVTIEHTLKPFAVVMAGPNEWDPYKD